MEQDAWCDETVKWKMENGVAFDSADLKVALDWCKHERWDRHPDFPKAWKELSAMVSPQPK